MEDMSAKERFFVNMARGSNDLGDVQAAVGKAVTELHKRAEHIWRIERVNGELIDLNCELRERINDMEQHTSGLEFRIAELEAQVANVAVVGL